MYGSCKGHKCHTITGQPWLQVQVLLPTIHILLMYEAEYGVTLLASFCHPFTSKSIYIYELFVFVVVLFLVLVL